MKIITNNHLIPLIYWWELSDSEKQDFDYCSDECLFFRYRWNLYSLCDFMRLSKYSMFPDEWRGYMGDSAFSGILVKYPDHIHTPTLVYIIN